MSHPIKVLLVEDSPIALAILQKLLASSREVEVVGTAENGIKALELIPQVQPHVICTDLHMKGMDGFELTKQVMAHYPRPILVVSNSVQSDDSQNIFELLQAGAVDVFPKPVAGTFANYEQAKQKLISKIKVLSGVRVFTRTQKPPGARTTIPPCVPTRTESVGGIMDVTSPLRAVAIGASTGGPKALHDILSRLPSRFPVPIICTQHISIGFLQGLVDWLSSECRLVVKIAQEGESPLPGTIYFAPDCHHLELNRGKFIYSSFDAVDGHRPSITAMFASVARFYGRGTAGILLTGMGKDGAAGIGAIAAAGGTTIAQDQSSCVIFGMPKEAIALGAVQHVLPLAEIAPWLVNTMYAKK